MRKVEQDMLKAIRERRDRRSGNTAVEFDAAMPAGYIGRVTLHGNIIARLLSNGEAEADRTVMALWPTRTTASRMRALGFEAYFKDGRFYYPPPEQIRRGAVMSNRITENQLQLVVDRINSVMGTPQTMFPTGKAADGMNEGHYHLDYAYGGVALEQTGKVTRHGQGSRNVFGGHVPKRELYGLMQAYIDGVRDYRAMIQTEGQ